MSLKRTLVVSSAAIALFAAANDASAQYRYYDLPPLGSQRQDRPAAAPKIVRTAKPNTHIAKTPVPSVSKPPVPPVSKPPFPPVSKPAVEVAKPVPVAPLTEEQLAAKAAVDELLAREPALAAARERPDPALVKAAVARHNAHEARLAALKAKQDAEAAKRQEIADKIKAREEAKASALQAKQDVQVKNTKAKPEASGSKPDGIKTSTTVAPAVPAQPLVRMPTPDALPPVLASR